MNIVGLSKADANALRQYFNLIKIYCTRAFKEKSKEVEKTVIFDYISDKVIAYFYITPVDGNGNWYITRRCVIISGNKVLNLTRDVEQLNRITKQLIIKEF